MFSLQDIVRDISDADSSISLFEKLNSYSIHLGFEYCCYGAKSPVPTVDEDVRIFDTYPNGWMAHYRSEGYLAVDPTVAQALKSTETILWPDAHASKSSRFWSDARDHGLTYGISQPIWSGRRVFGLMSFSRSREIIKYSEEKDLSLKIVWLANAVHSVMSDHKLLTRSMS